MREAAKMYKIQGKNGRNVVLISDGEDNEGHDKKLLLWPRIRILRLQLSE
jgi:hypothetical protein